MTQIHPYQILNGQQIHGGKSLVEREHFYTALQDDPVTMMETVNAVMDLTSVKHWLLRLLLVP